MVKITIFVLVPFFQIGPMSVQLTTPDKHKILGYSTALNDVFYANEVLDVRHLS